MAARGTYTLPELADWLFPEDMQPDFSVETMLGAGRNCTVFDELRLSSPWLGWLPEMAATMLKTSEIALNFCAVENLMVRTPKMQATMWTR